MVMGVSWLLAYGFLGIQALSVAAFFFDLNHTAELIGQLCIFIEYRFSGEHCSTSSILSK